ncbi:SDR family oxidoreductase [Pontibacter kalidii]|uniref:SDR family oxidoreductase n=1 Tax=Pontibacter kalidii TaxID=2592049 RepID=UPI00389A1C30
MVLSLIESLQGLTSFHPIGRVGRPGDIANTIAFLLSDETSWVTGAIIWEVDGGYKRNGPCHMK